MSPDPVQPAEYVAPKTWAECPSYDGVPEWGGPCWTCQGRDDQCPLTSLMETWEVLNYTSVMPITELMSTRSSDA